MDNTALLDELKQLLAQRIGLRVAPDAHERFVGVLQERAARLSYATLEEYRTFLAGNEAAGEWEKFARAFTSSETFFFRDHGQFDLLRLRLLPELIARHRNDKILRLWSAGCASGEEAYSLAMLVDMLLPEYRDWSVLILGTDIDSRAIAKAKHGRYGQWSFRMVPAALQQRYFHLEGDDWVLDERIRRMVTFRVANLIDEAFPDSRSKLDSGSELHDMDLILCRNVFIYFDSAALSAIAAKFSATLLEGGYLMTAHTELIGHPVRGLKSRLFAEGVVHQRRVHVPPPLPSPLDETTSHSTKLPKAAAKSLVTPRYAQGRELQLHPPLSGAGWVTNDLATVVGQPSQMASSSIRGGKLPPPIAPVRATPTAPIPVARNDELLFKEARSHADRGEYELAEQMCRKALDADPLAAAPYFLLAQLAQIKEDFEQAKECLNKAIYLDPHCVAAYLELATLYERAGDMARAQSLRRAALGIARAMPNDEQIEQYERTAGEISQWLELSIEG